MCRNSQSIHMKWLAGIQKIFNWILCTSTIESEWKSWIRVDLPISRTRFSSSWSCSRRMYLPQFGVTNSRITYRPTKKATLGEAINGRRVSIYRQHFMISRYCKYINTKCSHLAYLYSAWLPVTNTISCSFEGPFLCLHRIDLLVNLSKILFVSVNIFYYK